VIKISEWSSDFINYSGNRIHYYRTGDSKPPLILLHGITDNGLCWTPVARILSENYDVIMPDARIHGLTEVSDDLYTYDAMADDIAMLIKELNLDKANIAGHSMGGNVAALVAAKYPELINKVVLEDPAFRFTNFSFLARGIMKLVLYIAGFFLLSDDYEKLIKKCRKQSPTWAEEEYKPWAESKIQFKRKNPKKAYDILKSRYNWKEIYSSIACSLLLIIPEKGVTNEKLANKAISLCKSGKWIKINGAGHNIRREQFDEFIKNVVDFLE
jgi:N-formylmaleamate deformylase